MMDLLKSKLLKRQPPTALLGLALDGNRLEGVVLRRTNGSVEVRQSFSVALTLDLLTNDPVLVGREIRNHLDAMGVRERRCVVALPAKWALVAHTKLLELPEADIPSFLQIEAERGFPCDVETLFVATSRYRAGSGEEQATFVGIGRGHVTSLEQALRAAQLNPVSFTLGITALQPATAQTASGVLALVISESNVGMQVTYGGGVAALRALEGALESEGGRRQLHADLVAREARITLGQLPAGLRDAVRQIRIFGPRDLAQELASEMRLRFEPAGLEVEAVTAYAASDFRVQIPPNAAVSPAFSVGVRQLIEGAAPFEFFPPKVTAWQQFATRYSSGTLQRVGVGVGAGLLLVGGLFFFQQVQLWLLRSKWSAMELKVKELEAMQQNIRQYHPWFEESLRTLNILRQVTEAFPEDGVVSAKTVEIRDQSTVTCSGMARDNQAFLKTMQKLQAAPGVADLKVDQIRGKSPMQFTFDFHWNEGQQP
jgi:hypothetical protein